MKKFTYGFDATKQERNTINRQINRMEKRGYIFEDDIRSKIKTTKDLPDFLYKHSVYKPHTGGEKVTRVPWTLTGEEGKRAEEAIDKINRRNRALRKAGWEGIPGDLTPAKIGPYTYGKFGRIGAIAMKPGEIEEAAREALKRFEMGGKTSMAEWEKKTDIRAKENLHKSINTVINHMALSGADKKTIEALRDKIFEKIDAMTPREFRDFLKYSRFSVSGIYGSDNEDLRSNLDDLCKELGIYDEYEATIERLKRLLKVTLPGR